LSRTIESVDKALADYRFDLAAQALYEFTWNQFCDWYLELAKPALADDADPAVAAGTRRTLAEVLDALLRLLHPFVPFVTEEIWQKLKGPLAIEQPFLVGAAWPEAGAIDAGAEADAEWLKTVVSGIRSARTELGLAPGKPMPLMVQNAADADLDRLQRFDGLIRRLARLESIETVTADRDTADCAVQLAGEMRLLIPLAGLVDLGEEIARLEKQLDREKNGKAVAEKKLANERFVANAPAEVVGKERQRLAEHSARVVELDAQVRKLRALG
jgi:valyl-tRNA synthetase